MQISEKQKSIHLGTHGEDYGSWMSTPVFLMIGALLLAAGVLSFFSFRFFQIVWMGAASAAAAVLLLALLLLIFWVRRQYAFGGGGMMDKVHQTVISALEFDGTGTLLEVGCGSGPLSIRAALTWPEAEITAVDYWGAVYNFSQALCEHNAASEGADEHLTFRRGDARKLDFPDESFDAVISNYVFHNVTGTDKQELILESLRVLKKGGVFAFNDIMKPSVYGDMEAFARQLRDMGYQDVRLLDTAESVFGSKARAALLFLPESRMLIGRK